MLLKLLILTILVSLPTINCERILGIVPVASYSHQIAFRPLWKELSLRGHQVTLLTTDPLKDPTLTNLTEIDISFSYEILKKYRYHEFVLEFGNSMTKMWSFFANVSKELDDVVFKHPEIQNLIFNKSVEFDLIMLEYLVPSFFAFAHLFDVPFIALSSLDTSYMGHDCFGNPSHPVLNPDIFLPFQNNLTFIQRCISTFTSVYGRFFHTRMLAKADQIVKNYFGSDYPPLQELACKADLLFLNINPILDNIRPVVPAVINIGGGMHIQQSKPLPKVNKYLNCL